MRAWKADRDWMIRVAVGHILDPERRAAAVLFFCKHPLQLRRYYVSRLRGFGFKRLREVKQ